MPEEFELVPPDLDVEEYQRRREIAGVFYWQYIKGENDTDAAIDAISELISYGDDADKIIRMMALNIEE